MKPFTIVALIVACLSLGFSVWVNGYVTASSECVQMMTGSFSRFRP